jgi:hypothetical protein
VAFTPGGTGVLGRVLGRRGGGEERTCGLPAAFAEPARSEALLAAWRRHVGPARVVDGGDEPPGYETLMRAVWV